MALDYEHTYCRFCRAHRRATWTSEKIRRLVCDHCETTLGVLCPVCRGRRARCGTCGGFRYVRSRPATA